MDVSKRDAAPASTVNTGAAGTGGAERDYTSAPEAAPRAGAGVAAGARAPAGAEAGAGRGAKTGPAREGVKQTETMKKVTRGGGN